jgi:hypothetical protein
MSAADSTMNAIEQAAQARLHGMNEEWFVLDEHGDLSVCRWTRDDATGRRRLDRYTFAAFKQKFSATYLPAAPGSPTALRPLANAWLEWPGRQSFDRVSFSPNGLVPADVLNLWQGWGVKPCRGGDCERIHDHLMEVVCDGDLAAYNYLTAWMARMVQHPDAPGEVAIVLRGKEGVGKSVVGKLLRRIAGQHGLAVSSPKHIVGEFNAMLEDAVFVEASEALFAGDKAVASRLKALVTDDTITIERKGVDAREVRNRVHLLMTSNEDWVVPAGPESRRFFVLDVSDVKRGDTDYFEELWKQVNSDESVGTFLQELLDADISRFNGRKVPGTDALRDQRERSLTGVLAWALDLASRGGIVRTERGNEPWRSYFAFHELYEDFSQWVAGERYERKLARTTFSRDVQRLLGLHPQRQAKVSQPVPPHIEGARGFQMPESPRAFDLLVRGKAGLLPEDENNEAAVAA